MSRSHRIVLLCVALSATPLVAEEKPEKAKLTGTVECKDRGEFTPETVARITIEDVSVADAPAKVIAETTVKDLKAFPIPFVIEYDPAAIKPRARYALRVRIETGKRLDFINDTSIPVLSNSAPAKDVKAPVIKVKR